MRRCWLDEARRFPGRLEFLSLSGYAHAVADFTEIGRRLQVSLQGSGLQADELARRASLDPGVLSALIAGQHVKVSTAGLARLARVLQLGPTDLWASTESDDIRLAVHFRDAGIPDFFAADRPVLRAAIKECAQVHALNDALGLKPPLGYPWFEPEPVGPVPYEDGYKKARQVRDALHSKGLLQARDEPIEDISCLVEDAFGIPVLEKGLRARSVLALTVKEIESGAIAIVLNRNSSFGLSALRQRVDVAHELAHALFDEPSHPVSLWIDNSPDVETETAANDRTEQRARAFAAEVLMPRDGLRRLLGSPPSGQPTLQGAVDIVDRTRRHFATTVEIATNHVSNNGYFPEYMREEVTKMVPPAYHPSAPRQGLLERRVREAVGRNLITRMRARELLSLSAWDDLNES